MSRRRAQQARPRPGRPSARRAALARKAGRPIVDLAKQHTTVSVERATLRLAGLEGADPDGTPWVNRLADAVRADVGLEHGVALPVWDALRARRGATTCATLAQKAAAGSVHVPAARGHATPTARRRAAAPAGRRRHQARSTRAARERERLITAVRRRPAHSRGST